MPSAPERPDCNETSSTEVAAGGERPPGRRNDEPSCEEERRTAGGIELRSHGLAAFFHYADRRPSTLPPSQYFGDGLQTRTGGRTALVIITNSQVPARQSQAASSYHIWYPRRHLGHAAPAFSLLVWYLILQENTRQVKKKGKKMGKKRKKVKNKQFVLYFLSFLSHFLSFLLDLPGIFPVG
ncbi:hypothetical protein ACQP0C_41990 (plasmid) [Nocardia sp. CA-129566]|uniref:hypothetical protein n=1 Tax=Nocardia sp. CA-129566 TaxID=3239976 RepID=UPI003D98A8EF